MGTQNTGLKRGPVFNTNFTIPKKKILIVDDEPSQSVVDVESKFEQAKLVTENETILPCLARKPHKELPKTNVNKKGLHTVFNDPTLPQELTIQFQPLFCKLCECQHTSNVMAKLHYDSKRHDKKVRKFLVDFAEKTGTTLHPRATLVKQNDTDPKYFYCDSCEIPLTGRLHAESHYMSKNHRRVILGTGLPSGRERNDCFGSDFVKQVRVQDLRCQLCNVVVTSEQQMTLHINGSRHKKKMRVVEPDNSEVDTILSTLGTSVPKTDLSVFRTPTGFYYCNPCNITLNSETQFKQHLDSKRHKKKSVSSV
ncbi:hypothetical protein RN001_010415 [Aquatica leii]|uniref:C2H2-type domain-containing protein n=1 Tax=Aquatica leii TaxID=1421715 RepID=A0AAN7PUT8_9COLE|nr:hypothetical protein RN001_010415 [Aquatica leii]